MMRRRIRAGAVRSSGKYQTMRGKTIKRAESPRSRDRSFIRLVICGALFVLLVGIKLLFPEVISGVAASAVRLIGGNADFREAFAAVGRAVSGDTAVSDSLQEAYTAVFQPSVDSEIRRNDLSAEVFFPKVQETVASDFVAQSMPVSVSPQITLTNSDTQEVKVDLITDSSMYLCLPDNASMEQRNLGFSCVTPVQGSLTSSFGWREHPVFGGTKFHYGIDLAADIGTDVYAFADGEVFATGTSSTLGKYIILSHDGGYKTLYAHCSEVVVRSGTVERGEKIAEVGDTGEATGPHLHFELQCGMLYLNPIYYVAIG